VAADRVEFGGGCVEHTTKEIVFYNMGIHERGLGDNRSVCRSIRSGRFVCGLFRAGGLGIFCLEITDLF
jgi:hypothetical protein